MKKTREVQETLAEYPESSAISQDIVTSNFKKFFFNFLIVSFTNNVEHTPSDTLES